MHLPACNCMTSDVPCVHEQYRRIERSHVGLEKENTTLRAQLLAHEKAWEAMRGDAKSTWVRKLIDRHKPKGDG